MASPKRIIPPLSEQQINQFWSKVLVTANPDKCWIWQGKTYKNGYGRHNVERSGRFQSHRVAYLASYPDFDQSLCVLHECDVRLCQNPAHLFLGTHQDNSDDMVAKGRQAKGERSGRYTKPEKTVRGDRHYSRTNPEKVARGSQKIQAKLHESFIGDIRERSARGESYLSIADSYSVSRSTIWRVANRKRWRHVL